MSNCPLHGGEKHKQISYNNRGESDIPEKAGEELERSSEKRDLSHRYKLLLEKMFVYSQSRLCSIICNFLNLRINPEEDNIISKMFLY
jgi:hypothetical protein